MVIETMNIDDLLDLFVDLPSGDRKDAVRSEIRRRAEPRPGVGATPEAIVKRAVSDLRHGGWHDIADACLLLFGSLDRAQDRPLGSLPSTCRVSTWKA